MTGFTPPVRGNTKEMHRSTTRPTTSRLPGRGRSVRLLVAAAIVGVLSLLAPQVTAAAPTVRPHATTYLGAIAYNAFHQGEAPPGANDWGCEPTAAHPRPVVLLHGTFANMTNAWQRVSPALVNQGYCVFALDYGGQESSFVQGTGDIPTAAAEVDAFVDQVLAATDAEEVDLVGHSQGGGILPRWYLTFLGGADEVHTLVGFAPSNHGTTVFGLGTLARAFGLTALIGTASPAAEQQIIGSSTNAQLDAGGDTVPGVSYTNIVTRYDEVVTPYTNQYLSGPNVTNILLQRGCWIDYSEHLGIVYSPRAIALMSNALDPAHPQRVPCTLQLVP